MLYLLPVYSAREGGREPFVGLRVPALSRGQPRGCLGGGRGGLGCPVPLRRTSSRTQPPLLGLPNALWV